MVNMFKDATSFDQNICWPHTATKPLQTGMWDNTPAGGWGNCK